MKSIITIILILQIFCCNAQQNVAHIPLYKNGDTTLWYGLKSELINEIQLDDFLTSPEFRFRFWTNNQLIDISEDSGFVICYERKYKDNDWKRKKKRKLYTKKFELSQVEMNQLRELLDSSGILELPSEEDIEGWSLGLDGITYTVELADNSEYHFRTYWTPNVQTELSEAKLVNDFINNLNDILELKNKYDQFFAKLPKGCYNNGDITVICKE